jgi:hypothetical protein
MEKKRRIAAGIAVAICLTLLIIPRIFPVGMLVETVSGSQIPMSGFYAFQAEFLIALASLLVAGTLFFLKGGEARRLAVLFLALLGAIIILFPQSWVIGVCAHDNRFTITWTIIGGLLLILTGLYTAWIAYKADPEAEEDGAA